MRNQEKYYYCPDSCRFGKYSQTGDGYHSPFEPDFTCTMEDECVDADIINFSADINDTLCPFYKREEEVVETEAVRVARAIALKRRMR